MTTLYTHYKIQDLCLNIATDQRGYVLGSWMSMGGRGTKWCRNIAKNFNCPSRVHECYRRQTDRRTGGDIQWTWT